MKRFLWAALLATAIAPITAEAGPIDQACMASNQKQKSWALCRCIQDVANQTLSRADQRRAAKFFQDPHKAQEIRQSDSRTHEKFWLRYKEFGAAASATCK